MDESRITIRIPVELHERLRVTAALKEKSINRLIVEVLDVGTPPEWIRAQVQERFTEDDPGELA